MMCASTTWFVESSAFEMNAPSRSFSLRKVEARTAFDGKNILRFGVAQVRVRNPTVREGVLIVTRRLINCALPHGRASDTKKGFSRPKPFAVKRYRLGLALNSLDARIEIQLESIHRNIDVPVDVAQPHGRRVTVLLNHLRLHRHAAFIDPQLDVLIAGSGLGHRFQVSCLNSAPDSFFALVLKVAKPDRKSTRL